MGVRIFTKKAQKLRNAHFSRKPSNIDQLLRGVLWWPYGKYHNPIRSYGYGENTLCGLVFSVSVRLENGYFSVRPANDLYRRTVFRSWLAQLRILISILSRVSFGAQYFLHEISFTLYFRMAYKVNCYSGCIVLYSCCETFSQAECTHPADR